MESSESKVDTRQALIQAAKTVFGKRGFAGATVKELAETAGVNVSLVSYHFNGKEGLYRACLEEFGNARLAASERILKPAGSREEFKVRLRLYLEEFINTHIEEPDVCAILHREMQDEMEITRDIFRNVFFKNFELLSGFFAHAQKTGYVRQGLDPAAVASFLMGSMIHIARSDCVRTDILGDDFSIANPKFREQAIEQLILVFTEGTFTPPGSLTP